MIQKALKNISILVALNLLIKPLWVLCDIHVQNTVGATQYGLYISLFSFCTLTGILLDLGTNQMNTRELSLNPENIQRYFSTLIILKLLLIPMFFIFSFAIGYSIGYDSLQLKFLFLIGINQILTSLLLYVRSNLQALQKFRIDSVLSIADRSILIAILVILFFSPFKIEYFIYAQTASYGLAVLIGFILLRNHIQPMKFSFNTSLAKSLFKKSYPYALLWATMGIYSRIDSVMIERLLHSNAPEDLGKYSAGIYAAAFRLLDFSSTVPLLYATILLPVFTRTLQNKNELEPLVKNSFVALLFPVTLVVVTCVFYSAEIMHLIYPNINVEESAPLLTVLMITYLCFTGIYIYGTLLTGYGALFPLIGISIIATFGNVILNFFLIPKFYALGAAYATLATQALALILHLWLSQKYFHFHYSASFLFRLMAFLLFSFIIGYTIKEILYFSWTMKAVLTIAAVILSGFMLKLIEKKTIYSILKS